MVVVLDSEGDLSALGELHRVGDKIERYLVESGGIPDDRRERGGQLGPPLKTLIPGHLLAYGRNAAHHLGQVHCPLDQPQLPHLTPRQVGHIAHQAAKLARAHMNTLQVLSVGVG